MIRARRVASATSVVSCSTPSGWEHLLQHPKMDGNLEGGGLVRKHHSNIDVNLQLEGFAQKISVGAGACCAQAQLTWAGAAKRTTRCLSACDKCLLRRTACSGGGSLHSPVGAPTLRRRLPGWHERGCCYSPRPRGA